MDCIIIGIWIFNVVEGFSSRSNKDPVILPTAPRAARGPGIDEENIPTSAPYVAYISNLPYDIEESDLVDFFTEMKVSLYIFEKYEFVYNSLYLKSYTKIIKLWNLCSFLLLIVRCKSYDMKVNLYVFDKYVSIL